MNNLIFEIAEERRKQGISETALAAKIGVDQNKVWRLLNGKTKRLDLDLIEKLRGALGMVAEPLTAYGISTIHQAITPGEAELLEVLRESPDSRDLVEAYIKLPPRKQKIFLGKLLEVVEEVEKEGN